MWREYLAAYFEHLGPDERPAFATDDELWDIVTLILQTPREQLNDLSIAQL